MAATETLIEAGRTLATIAEPDRDLHDIGSDFAELAETLRLIGGGIELAMVRAENVLDGRMESLAAGKLWNLAERREWTRDEVELSHRNELARARDTARRTAQRALVDLARLIRELEII